MNQQKTGKYIAEKRKLHNMTQAQLAEKLGVSDRAVSKWERGLSMPDVSKYEELCEVLEVSLNELFSGEDLDEDRFREQSDQNLIEVTKKEKGLRKKHRILNIFLILVLVIAGVLYIYQNWPHPVNSTEHIGFLTYEMPETGYTHSRNAIITEETGFGYDEVIIGKKYLNKDTDTEIVVSSWDKDWHEFAPTIEYEKNIYPYAFEEYIGEIPDFIEQVSVFHEEIEFLSVDSIYDYYYRAYVMTDEKHNNFQYVLTVFGNDFDQIREIGERIICSMGYDDTLQTEFVRYEED